MIFKARKSYWFTPDVGDNVSLPESKQLRVKIERPDAETKEELQTTVVSRDYTKGDIIEARERRSGKRRGDDDDEVRKQSVQFINRVDTGRILRDHVPEIVNCEVEEADEAGKTQMRKIKSGQELAICTAYGIDRLVQAVCAEVLNDAVPEDLEKNSESASASS